MSSSPHILPDTDGPLPFPNSTGRRIRIAVIDSGVNDTHAHILGVAGGVAICHGKEDDPTSYVDRLGHGTAVMAAIQEKAPGAQYYAVKLFHDSLLTTTNDLLAAIGWAIEARMDVINLSLGTRNPAHVPRFAPLIERAAANGTLLVSALESDGQVCFPGSLDGVIGVGVDWEMNRHSFRIEDAAGEMKLYASGYPRSLPGVPRKRNLSGISFAVANMSGLIARACEGLADRSISTLREALIAETEKI